MANKYIYIISYGTGAFFGDAYPMNMDEVPARAEEKDRPKDRQPHHIGRLARITAISFSSNHARVTARRYQEYLGQTVA